MILKLDYSPEPVKNNPIDIIRIEFPKIMREMPIFAIIKVIITAYLLPKLSAKKVKKMKPATFPRKIGNL